MTLHVAETLLTDIQDAFLNPETWPSALDGLSAAAGARGATILSLTDRVAPSPSSTSLHDVMERYRRSEWCQNDFRVRGIPKLLRTGITVDQDFCSVEDVRRHPFYADFLAGQGLRWFAGIRFTTGSTAWCLALQRSPSQGPFEPDEQVALRRLCAPLSEAGAVADKVSLARAGGMVDGLELIGCAAVLLDARGRHLRHNAAAEPYFADDLGLEHGALVPRRGPREPLSSHIAAALAGSGQHRRPVMIHRKCGRGLLVSARTLHGEAGAFFQSARLLVTIVDLDGKAQGDVPGLLRQTYRLTLSEARIAQHVGGGASVKTAAEPLGLRIGTVRSTLKQIFSKCGVSRQAELVGLLSQVTTAAQPTAGDTTGITRQ